MRFSLHKLNRVTFRLAAAAARRRCIDVVDLILSLLLLLLLLLRIPSALPPRELKTS
jgi:hypothetical protein